MSNLEEPHKIGAVMWTRSPRGHMIPSELLDRVTEADERSLNTVFDELMRFRKIEPALMVIRNTTWDRPSLVRDHLRLSIQSRSGARKMIADGDWDPFWSSLY